MDDLADGAVAARAGVDGTLQELVNRLTQELANLQRTVAESERKLSTTARSLESRTQELEETRSELASLLATLDASDEGILAMGYFGRAMHFNTRFVQIWGIPPHKAAVLNDAALLALQLTQVTDPARFLDFVQARRARPDEERHEMFEMTDGRMLDCRVLPQRVRGRRVGAVTCYRDVTDQLRLEELVTTLQAGLSSRFADTGATTF